MEDQKKLMGRRAFLTNSAKIGAAGVIGASVLSSCGGQGIKPLRKKGEYYVPDLPDKADDGRELKVGLVGCGGRGTGALGNLLEAADGITVAALGDILPDQMASCRSKLYSGYGVTVPDDKCFLGFDSYQKVIDSGVDMVILATPPVFRPTHFEYATGKGVHSFLEKPVAIDPTGFRRMLATSRLAESKGLSVVTGTQRRHERGYVASYQKIQEGWIGEIVSGTVYWLQGKPWYATRKPGMSDVEYMIRDWFNWSWLAGDHIVEQHVHNIDVFLWMSGMTPFKATGFGSRLRRRSGDQFDQFYVDFEFPSGVRLNSQCRQVDGCTNRVGEVIMGTRGIWTSKHFEITDYNGKTLWKYDEEGEKARFKQHDPYVLEHVDWVNHIRRGTMHVEAEESALSCMAGIMGRESAYSGKRMLWEDMIASKQNYLPEKVELVDVDMSQFKVPQPGI